MKALSKFFLPLIVLLGLAGCGGGGSNSNGNTGGAFNGGTYSLTVVAGSTTLAQNSSTGITVTVKNPDGTTVSNGTSVSLSVTPAGAGTVSAGSGAGSSTATATTAGGSAAFTFSSAALGGTAHVTASVQNTNGTASTASVDINVSSVSNPLIKLTASTTTLPLNPFGPSATTYPFPSNYIGSPYIAEVTIEWRHANGALVNGTLKVNASIAPVTVAGFSTLDDPATPWSGQSKSPPTVDGNEFLTILGSGPVNVTAGIGTIFVHADNVPGTAILSVTGVDPDTQQPLSNQIAITVVGAASPKLPGAVTVTQASGGVYVSGANGPQSKVVSAQVLDGNGAIVADPTDGKGNTWDNVQFQIVGPAGTDATLSAISASGATQSGTTVVTTTHNGIANVTFRAGSQQGPVQVKATVDRGDNNVDNQIQDPISATATVIVSDGKLYSLTLTSPGSNAPAILINRVSTLATLVNQTGTTIPPDPNATYSFTISAIGTDRQGNPPLPGTVVNFGSIDTPQSNFTFNISGVQGDPQEGGKIFSAPDGHFVTAGGGAGPGDTLIVFGKQIQGAPVGNDDLESAVKVASVVSETQLNVATAFNFNDTTGATVNNGPVLPYVVGRATVGNISTPATTDSVGVASTTLNYPVSQLGRLAAVWAQGTGVDTVNGSVRMVTDAAITAFPGVAPAKIIISPNPIPGNITTSVQVCIYDALGSPLPGVAFGFSFTNLGVGSGSVDGVSGAGTTASITGSSGCVVTTVKTSGIASSGSGTGGPSLTFSAGSASATAPITASGGLILLANPSACGGTGCTVTLTLLNSNGTPVSGVQLTGTCTGDASVGLASGPGVTDANGATTATITANLNGVNSAKSGSCTFTTATGSPTATVTLQGIDLCKTGVSPLPAGCAVATSTVALQVTAGGAGSGGSFTSSPAGLACSAAKSTTQTCTGTVGGGTYTLTATGTSPVWSGSCVATSPGASTATLTVPATTTAGLTCSLTVN